jgi:toxin ParE1/3/4
MTLQWSPESMHDLIALRAHIAEHDPAAAKRVALHILYCVEYLLSENPKLGAPGRAPGTRELVIPKTPYPAPPALPDRTIAADRPSSILRREPKSRKLIGDVGQQPQRRPGGSSGSVCWPSSLESAPRLARARVGDHNGQCPKLPEFQCRVFGDDPVAEPR